jgi:hypothetical protein
MAIEKRDCGWWEKLTSDVFGEKENAEKSTRKTSLILNTFAFYLGEVLLSANTYRRRSYSWTNNSSLKLSEFRSIGV